MDFSPGSLLGVHEVGQALGLSRGALHWRRRYAGDFPAPVAELASGPVWTAEQIREYARRRCERFVEREGVERLAAAASVPAVEAAAPDAAAGDPLSVDEAAAVLGIPAARLRRVFESEPRLPAVVRLRDSALLGIPARALGVWGRYLADQDREFAAGWPAR